MDESDGAVVGQEAASSGASELEVVRATVAAQRRAAAALRGRRPPVASGELNPGGGEYLETLPPGPAGTGGQVGDGKDASMTTVLVPLDGSQAAEAALPVARRLAEGLHATVVLTTVPEPGEPTADLEQRLLQATAQLLPLPVRRRIETVYDPVGGILQAVHDEQPAVLVMVTHGRSARPEHAYGRVVEAVVRAGVVPVTLVRPAGLNSAPGAEETPGTRKEGT